MQQYELRDKILTKLHNDIWGLLKIVHCESFRLVEEEFYNFLCTENVEEIKDGKNAISREYYGEIIKDILAETIMNEMELYSMQVRRKHIKKHAERKPHEVRTRKKI
jgi:hypothetical protein